MDNAGDASYRSWSPSRHRRIDEACARFEAALKAGEKPAVEDYLRSIPDADRAVLERELRAIEAELGGHGKPRVSLDQFRENLVRSGLLSDEQAVECILQAARGLQYAHCEGVVHRDI